MSIFHASFQKARSGMLTNICEIEKVVELTDEEYERFSQNLTVSSELLSQESDRFRVDEHGIARCLLVMAEGRQDGTLVLTEGYDYARHTAHLPNARQFLKMEQSFRLAEFVDRMHSLTNQFVADAIDRQVEGEYKVSLAPIRKQSGQRLVQCVSVYRDALRATGDRRGGLRLRERYRVRCTCG